MMRTKMCWTLVGLFLLAGMVSVSAQPPAEPNKGPAAEGAPAAKPGPQAAEFARLLAQFKKLEADAGTIKLKYPTADAAQRPALRKEFDDLMAKMEVLLGQLVAAAEKAYIEAPNADREVTGLLCTMLEQWVQQDNDEDAYALGKLLLDHHCTIPQVADLAGTAAFAVGEPDAAEEYLKLAAKGGGLSKQGRAILDGLPGTRRAWEKEKQFRQAEAKADDLPRVLLKTTRGDIELELFENEAPNTVANFITLVEKGFYNGLTFHRVLPGFMAQGGDPKGNGQGGPGYSIAEEFTKPNHRLHFRGSLAMARSASPDSAGSQFYLMFAPVPSLKNQLDGNYTVFGRVIKGFEVLAKIQRRDPDQPDQPTPDKIVKAEVLRKRPHPYEVKKLPE